MLPQINFVGPLKGLNIRTWSLNKWIGVWNIRIGVLLPKNKLIGSAFNKLYGSSFGYK